MASNVVKNRLNSDQGLLKYNHFVRLLIIVIILVLVVLIGEFVKDLLKGFLYSAWGVTQLTWWMNLIVIAFLFLILYFVFDRAVKVHLETILSGGGIPDDNGD